MIDNDSELMCFVSCATQNRWTPLHGVCIEGHNDITEVLLKDGADVMAADEVSTEMIDSRIDNVWEEYICVMI